MDAFNPTIATEVNTSIEIELRRKRLKPVKLGDSVV